MINQKNKVRAAIIGAGSFTNKVHCPSLKKIEDVEICAICDVQADVLKATAEKFGIPKQYADHKKMLADESPDAVYAIMPPHHVFDVAVYCLSQKLNLFIEKPPGLTTRSVKQLALLAEKNGCITMCGFQRRHVPVIRKAREIVESKGRIHSCAVQYHKFNGKTAYYGGAIDILTCDAIHAVDTLRWLAGGEVKAVAADCRCLSADFYNSFHALITFTSGMTGILLANWVSGRRLFQVEMHSDGALAIVEPDEGARIFKDNDLKGEWLDTKQVAGSEEEFVYNGFYAEHRHFIECLKSRTLPISHLGDSLKTMELVDRIYSSQI